MRSNLHDIEVIFQHQTHDAICVREHEHARDVWLPKSQVEFTPKSGGQPQRWCVLHLTAPERLLTEKGLV